MEMQTESNGALTLHEVLEETNRQFSDKPAIHDESATLTYGQFVAEVNHLAGLLQERGVGKGDRVFIALPNCAAFAVAYFACFRIGAVAVPFSTQFKAKEMASLLAHSRPSAGVFSAQSGDVVRSATKESGISPLLAETSWGDKGAIEYTFSGPGRMDASPDSSRVSPDDAAVILYTSGTTGTPKGVVLSHRNVISNVRACREAMPVSESDVFLLFLPMYHSFGFTTCVVLPIFLGASCVILPGPKKELIASAVARFRATVSIGIPALYGIMAKADHTTASLFDSIRFFVSGAAPLPLPTLEAFSDRYKAPLLEGYGLTEAAPVVSLNPWEGARKKGSIGIPLPGVSVRVVDEVDRDLDSGQIGELLIKGPNVMIGYFADDEATRGRIKDGWLYTGDMARLDEDGYIYIEDRKDDMIVVQGANVYPHEVEDTIKTIPGVLDVAVVGVRDVHLGKRPVAVVQPAELADLTEKDVISVCRRQLSDFKAPRQVLFWKEMPLSPLGKPLKRKIRQMLDAEQGK